MILVYRNREIIARSVSGVSNEDIATTLRIEEKVVERVLLEHKEHEEKTK